MARVRTHMIRIWLDVQAQDLVEYALLAGFVAVAAAVAFPASIGPSVAILFNKVQSVLVETISRMS